MNRKINVIDSTKWYHLETLKKYFIGHSIIKRTDTDINGKEFTFIQFKKLWGNHIFIVHPKTKRLRKNTYDALVEAGFNS